MMVGRTHNRGNTSGKLERKVFCMKLKFRPTWLMEIKTLDLTNKGLKKQKFKAGAFKAGQDAAFLPNSQMIQIRSKA